MGLGTQVGYQLAVGFLEGCRAAQHGIANLQVGKQQRIAVIAHAVAVIADNKLVALGRDVKKPKGVRAGLVTVGRYRTVVVEPHRLDEPGE